MTAPTAPAVIVLIPTPSKPIRIRRISPRPDLPASLVVRGADFRSLRWSNDYQQFVSPHGPVQALVKKRAGGAFMLQVEDEIDDGRSWEVPVLIAHRLLDQGHPFATSDDEALMVVFATGQLDFDTGKAAADQAVGAGEYHLSEKIRAAVPMLRDAAGRGARVVCLIPPGPGSEEAVKLLERALPNTNRWIARCETFGDITATLDLAVSNLGATPNPLMIRPDPEEAARKARAEAAAKAKADADAEVARERTAGPGSVGETASDGSGSTVRKTVTPPLPPPPPLPPEKTKTSGGTSDGDRARGVSMGVMAAVGAVVLSLGGVAALVATGTLSIGGKAPASSATPPAASATSTPAPAANSTAQGLVTQPAGTPATTTATPPATAPKVRVAALRPPAGKQCADLAFDPNLQLVATPLTPEGDLGFQPVSAFELCGLEFRPVAGGSAAIDTSLDAVTFRRSAVGPEAEFGAGTRIVFRQTRLPAVAPKLTVKTATGETVTVTVPITP